MKLLNREIEAILPPLNTTQGKGEPTIYVTLTDPASKYVWFIIEGERQPHRYKPAFTEMVLWGLVSTPKGNSFGTFYQNDLKACRDGDKCRLAVSNFPIKLGQIEAIRKNRLLWQEARDYFIIKDTL